MRPLIALVAAMALLGMHIAASAFSGANGRIAYVDHALHSTRIVVEALDGTNSIPLAHAAPGETEPVWSPDGSHIAFRRGSSWLVTSAPGTGTSRSIVQVGDARLPGELTWSPDGRTTAVTPDCAITAAAAHVTLATDGRRRTIRLRLGAAAPTVGEATSISNWGFAPDGESLLISATPAGDECIHDGLADASLYRVSLDGRIQRRIMRAPAPGLGSVTWSPDGTEIAYSLVCFNACQLLVVRLSDRARRTLFTLKAPGNQDPVALEVVWLSTRFVIGVQLDRSAPLFAVDSSGRRRPLPVKGYLVQCVCGDLVAVDTGTRVVLADPSNGRLLRYPSRINGVYGDESVYSPG